MSDAYSSKNPQKRTSGMVLGMWLHECTLGEVLYHHAKQMVQVGLDLDALMPHFATMS